MRNFSSTNQTNIFTTISINGGEYVNESHGDVDKTLLEVLKTLARMMETPFEDVSRAWRALRMPGLFDQDLDRIPSSELRILENLRDFICIPYAVEANDWHSDFQKRADWLVPETCIFTYVNLNTGAQLSWIASWM